MSQAWSNLAAVVFKRTYARKLFPGADGSLGHKLESWEETCNRAIMGNVRNHNVSEAEIARLKYFTHERKAGPAGRGYWYSGTDAHARIGGVALNNCWFEAIDNWMAFVIAQDLLMLGGGVGGSVEHKYVSKLPKIKRGVQVVYRNTKDADFIVPDSREGWVELTRRVLESYFQTGKSFSYSTVCIRPAGDSIAGFGGSASGPKPLVLFVEKLSSLLGSREGKHARPIDAADILCAIGEMVVAGNVRRSAIIVIGDAFDKEYLKAKRWDLGPIPTQRAMANWSVSCEDVEDLHPLYWKTYEHGEAFGLVNVKNIQKFGRIGEPKKDTATGVNPCGEATLESHEPCNLQEIALPNLLDENEFIEAARLMHRWGKRVTAEKYHWAEVDEVIKRNRRIGTGITGCMQSALFNPTTLDRAYAAIQEENISYSKELGINPSIRTTVIKPSGTMSKVLDVKGEGIHGGFSRYMIQRVRFSSNDALIPLLRSAGHYMEPVVRFDGTHDTNTMVVDFYESLPLGLPTADEGWDTWKQLEVLLMSARHWADQSVSVTVYYRRDEIPRIKQWLSENIGNLKTISFLCHSEHGFKQAPKEAITVEQYEKLSSKIKSIDVDRIGEGELDSMECSTGACPIK